MDVDGPASVCNQRMQSPFRSTMAPAMGRVGYLAVELSDGLRLVVAPDE